MSSNPIPGLSGAGPSSGTCATTSSIPLIPSTNSESDEPENVPLSFYLPRECVVFNLTSLFVLRNVGKANNKKKYISKFEDYNWFRDNPAIFKSSYLCKATKVPDQPASNREILSQVLHYLYGNAHMHNFTISRLLNQEQKIFDLERQVGTLEESLKVLKVGEPKYTVRTNMTPEHTKFLSARQAAWKYCEPVYQHITKKNPSTFTVIAKLTYHSNSSEANTLSCLCHCEQAVWFDGNSPGSGYCLVPTEYINAELQYMDSKLVESLFQPKDFDSTTLIICI
ncbi:hypothetical protein BCR33DRAFT_743421 [Rhizoclosmatium globosum]|uniref:Uncharacterized protein n=1 Tax=Rhizoclosmatium globosum TaxID=329046 RepID=A0A1Y2BIS3_9FUNG|nr:hypothetical protein BCR33DRAFT_743421 [Rhizoclosmatium globosum]|eukprot:ORY34480.1 hypothetical protein BCR33DRAFT_743421 [Rhizoclosmatium globosum]